MYLFYWFLAAFTDVFQSSNHYFRTQKLLRNITFYNANLRSTDSLKLLMACLGSQQSIIHLNIVNCHYDFRNPINVNFNYFVENLSHLTVLKLDYVVLCNGVFDAILSSKNVVLKVMDICVKENDGFTNLEINEDNWQLLKLQCPKLKVAFSFCKYI